MFNLKNKLNSTEGRKYIHHRLLTIARNANSVGKCKGLLGFIHEIDDENEIKKIYAWIKLYTPIRIDSSGKILLFTVPSTLVGKYDLTAAALNPYYSIDLDPVSAPQVSRTIRTVGNKTQLNERQFIKKNIKFALEQFLLSPNTSNKNKLINLLDSFPNHSSGRGSMFISGGLPGLGRR
jgi:hypothetical protein